MISRKQILWVDGFAGAIAGVAVLLASGWLCDLYRLPVSLLVFIGTANLVYGCYSISLASRARRPKILILLLVVANLSWAVLCLRWAFVYAETASFFGLAQFIAEAIFVAGLASLEWRWRGQLLTA